VEQARGRVAYNPAIVTTGATPAIVSTIAA
jgi:hypothetical protein